MKSQALLLRVPVVIFAVLVGGIYVYARSGGRFFTTPVRATPAAEAEPFESPVGLMMGSKSAPAFTPEPAPSIPQQASPRPALLPGSKSAIAIEVAPVPQPTNAPTMPMVSPRLLPGSKSVILVDPPGLAPSPQPPVNTQQQQAVQRSAQQTGPPSPANNLPRPQLPGNRPVNRN
jgi:hypothetical protein